MDNAQLMYVSYRWHRIANPCSLEQIERVLDFADLAPGDKAADLGCGNGLVSGWMAERWGLDLAAVERAPEMAALARAELSRPLGRGRARLVEASAHEYLAEAGEHRLIALLGPSEVFPDLRTPAQQIKALAPSLAPGGWLMWGDVFWKQPPGPRLAALYAPDRYESLAGWAAAGESAGLTPHYAAVSGEPDWETFIWKMNASLEAWGVEGPSESAAAARQRAAALRDLYLNEGRETVGFVVFLFRRPVA